MGIVVGKKKSKSLKVMGKSNIHAGLHVPWDKREKEEKGNKSESQRSKYTSSSKDEEHVQEHRKPT